MVNRKIQTSNTSKYEVTYTTITSPTPHIKSISPLFSNHSKSNQTNILSPLKCDTVISPAPTNGKVSLSSPSPIVPPCCPSKYVKSRSSSPIIHTLATTLKTLVSFLTNRRVGIGIHILRNHPRLRSWCSFEVDVGSGMMSRSTSIPSACAREFLDLCLVVFPEERWSLFFASVGG